MGVKLTPLETRAKKPASVGDAAKDPVDTNVGSMTGPVVKEGAAHRAALAIVNAAVN